MQLLHPKQEIKSPTVVTIGTFDGVHLGHRKIFEKVQKIARKKDLKSILVTFEPPPKRFFSNGKIENLTILSEKVEILADIGLDYFLVLPFNKELVRTSYKDFVKKTLKNSLQAKYLVVGYDFRMGHGKEGNPENLMEMGFFVTIIAPFKIEGEPVKSSFIRELVKEGKIERANKFLGYPYRLSGCLRKGMGIAKKLGFPSMNLQVTPEKLLPKAGVYAVRDMNQNAGMLYIGKRPTLDINEFTVEIHFIDYNKSSQKEALCVEILKKLRDERNFSSKNELIEQLTIDKSETKHFFKRMNV